VQLSAGLELLTTADAAAYLRLRERKLYELVADRQIPCTKVTGKWLFSRADLDRWLLAGMARPHGVCPAEPPPIVGGSHDPLLQWALSESGAGLAILPEGSAAGYRRLLNGEVIAAAIHFHALDGAERDASCATRPPSMMPFSLRLRPASKACWSRPAIRCRSPASPRLGTGNCGWRFVPKVPAHSSCCFGLLQRHRLSLADAGATVPAHTGPDVAQAIRAGRADCGIATRAVATAAGVGFLPLCLERFDLLLRQRDYFRPAWQSLLKLFADPRFAAQAGEFGGLDVSAAGSIRWAP